MITGTIITLNEETNIAACIASLLQVCDEIIVIDSESTDRTVEIARAAGAQVHIQKYLGDGPQKAFGVQFANNDWVLSLDADERLDEDAVAAIKGLDLAMTTVDAFSFRRKNFAGKHWVKAAGFYPDEVTRLYHKQRAGYLPKRAHSSVKAERVRALPAHIVHFTYDDYAHWVQRINQLSSRDAWAMYERGVKPSRFAPALHAITAVLRKYILKGGFLQGLDGATVTMTTAFHAYMKYLKLIELYEKKGPPGGKP
jgi:glycosyltransferase involved in cell wall biosynthesis